MNVINELRKIAIPNKMDTIPRYIGCRLKQNGPDVINEFGIS